jgi:hypothetical protein
MLLANSVPVFQKPLLFRGAVFFRFFKTGFPFGFTAFFPVTVRHLRRNDTPRAGKAKAKSNSERRKLRVGEKLKTKRELRLPRSNCKPWRSQP